MWKTVFNTDLTVQTVQSLTTDTGYTFDGVLWSKRNSANERAASHAAIVAGTGLQFWPAAATTYGAGVATAPAVTANLRTLIPSLQFGMRLRLSAQFTAWNGSAYYDHLSIGIERGTLRGHIFKRMYNGVQTFATQTVINNGPGAADQMDNSAPNGASTLTHDVLILECELGGAYTRSATGLWATGPGWPSSPTQHACVLDTLTSAPGSFGGDPTMWNIALACGTGTGSNAALTGAFSRVMLEFRP